MGKCQTRILPFAFQVLLFLVLTGCTRSPVMNLADHPHCRSSIEGRYHAGPGWREKHPAIVLRTGTLSDDYAVIFGGVVETRDDGVVFDPDRQSPLLDPPETYYAFSAIVAYIDPDGKVAYGEIPPSLQQNWKLVMSLRPLDAVSHRPVVLEMMPGERFGICVPPGRYEVEAITFIDEHGFIDRADSFEGMRLDVLPGSANYVGDFFLDEPAKSGGIRIFIPVVHSKRETDEFFGTSGPLGRAYVEGFRSGKKRKDEHALELIYEKGFVSAIELPVTTSRWRFTRSSARETNQDRK